MSPWNEFLASVKAAENQLGNPPEIWYRGHSNHEWNLIPSLLRLDNWKEKEQALFIEFNKTAARLFEPRNNDWERLFDMQHYWIPTRLLDWTTVLGVAISFIMYSDYDPTKDSALYILNPAELNRLSGKPREVINVPEDRAFDYQKIYLQNQPVEIEKPLAIRPTQQSERLRAQKGTFTVHGVIVDSFENLPTCFRKVILPASAKEEARDFLKWANLDEYTIYPDIVGMARHIKRKIVDGESA